MPPRSSVPLAALISNSEARINTRTCFGSDKASPVSSRAGNVPASVSTKPARYDPDINSHGPISLATAAETGFK